MNDYENTVEDLDAAIAAAETAYYNAQDEDLQVLIDDALDKLREARTKSGERA